MFVAVRVGGDVELAEAWFVLGPVAGAAGLLDRPHAAVQRLLAGRAQGEPAEARPVAGGEDQAVVLVVVVRPQMDRAALLAADREAQVVGEEGDAGVQVGVKSWVWPMWAMSPRGGVIGSP
ncbi:hypothetical protein GCM10010303_47760 [Streptomyces purpurascens]|nr:hypothetical protein GCM10010303_47760 [Streptomyces purpurascens]